MCKIVVVEYRIEIENQFNDYRSKKQVPEDNIEFWKMDWMLNPLEVEKKLDAINWDVCILRNGDQACSNRALQWACGHDINIYASEALFHDITNSRGSGDCTFNEKSFVIEDSEEGTEDEDEDDDNKDQEEDEIIDEVQDEQVDKAAIKDASISFTISNLIGMSHNVYKVHALTELNM